MRLIDADELKANINNWYDLVNSFGQTNIQLSHKDILAKIDNMPTIEEKPIIRGEWICANESCAICNKCNRLNQMYGDFCKYCGADMRKESEK